MRERTLEMKLVKETRKRGGVALKFVSPSFSGMPDRLVLLPHQVMGFVEVKAPGERPRPLQKSRHTMRREMGSLESSHLQHSGGNRDRTKAGSPETGGYLHCESGKSGVTLEKLPDGF